MSEKVPPADSDALFHLRRELAEMAARGTLGGAFYVLGWLMVGGVGGLFFTRTLLALAVLGLFAVLAVARLVLAWRVDMDRAAAQLACWWGVLLATAALWGGICAWIWLDPALRDARLACAICTIAYATAYVHTFPMRSGRALACVALLFLPGMLLTWVLLGVSTLAIGLTVYLLYLLLALRTSRGQYRRQLQLELALRDQRDLFERQSRTDALTGLHNRREFNIELERAFYAPAPLSLLMLDIDHFKQINDRHGHAAGDAVLVALAQRLRDHFAGLPASLARVGGEEFAVLLPDMAETEALALAEQLCRDIAATPCGGLRFTMSIGAGQRCDSDRKPEELLAAVDRALYRAKASGRNRVCQAA